MEAQLIEFDVESGIAVLKLNRPQVRNALNDEIVEKLHEMLDLVEREDELKALVLTGTGSSFCSGGDLAVLATITDPSDIALRHRRLVGLAGRIAGFSKPVLAAVNGPAVGAGASIALACDYILLASNASMRFPFLSLGLPPDLLVARELTRRSGATTARSLLYSCRLIQADEVLALRLCDSVVEPDELLEKALFQAKLFAANDRFAFTLAKTAIRNAYTSEDISMNYEPLEVASAVMSHRFQEVVARYRESN